MKYPSSPLTPFPPTFLRFRRTTHTLRAQREAKDRCRPNSPALCFHTIAASLLTSKNSTPSPSSKSSLFFKNTRGGVSPSDSSTLGESRRRPPPHLHNFSAPINTFKMNTCKSVSKQRTLTSFRMNTYAKRGGRGVSLLTQERERRPTPNKPVPSLLCATQRILRLCVISSAKVRRRGSVTIGVAR